MNFVSSVPELQELNPYIVIGCGGGGEKFSNFQGVKALGFIDDNPEKQGQEFCNKIIASDLEAWPVIQVLKVWLSCSP